MNLQPHINILILLLPELYNQYQINQDVEEKISRRTITKQEVKLIHVKLFMKEMRNILQRYKF